MTTIYCPTCYHSETMAARFDKRERCSDDPELMHWEPSTFDGKGEWVCERCGTRLGGFVASVLLDAALTAADPENNGDSFNRYTYEDCLRAFQGGSQ